MSIGNRLKKLRHDTGYSQQNVADKLGISKSKYCRIEANEAQLDTEELKKVLELYTISADDFLGRQFPIHRREVFPKEILDDLEYVLKKNEVVQRDWNVNRERFNELRKAATPILEIRMKICDFPELDLELMAAETTVRTVTLDARGESLIKKYFILQEEYCKALFGGV